jgi:iron complex outermembrane recepter protein
MRLSVAVALFALSSLCLAADPARASIRKDTRIPAEGLGAALQRLAKDYDFQVLYRTEIVRNLRTRGAVGNLSPEEALGQVLNGTGLAYKYLDEKTVTIVSAASTLAGEADAGAKPADGQKEIGKNSSQDFRVAELDQGATPQAASVTSDPSGAQSNASPGASLEEVLVTAQKRVERLQDVPVPVTVIDAEALVESNQLRLQDYYSSIPALSLAPSDLGGALLAIRGITAGPGPTSTVSVLVDDVPFGSSTLLGGYNFMPDFDPSDLQRIEELRGPQGTLYGASSLGGLLKFVTIDPSTDALSGRIQANVNDVYNADEPGYGVRGAVNVPLGDTLALRLTGFARHDPGYLDDPALGTKGVNDGNTDGGRFSALWQPAETFSLKLSALAQNASFHAYSEIGGAPGLGDLQQEFQPGTGPSQQSIEAYSATATARFGQAVLTAITGFNHNSFSSSYDETPAIGSLTDSVFGVPGTSLVNINKTNKFTQEVRLAMPLTQRIDWLVGLFFTRETSSFIQPNYALTAAGTPLGLDIVEAWGNSFTEYAAFTDVTFHITDHFDLQIGGREGDNRQTYWETDTGPLVPAYYGSGITSPIVFPFRETKDDSFTYLVTPQYKLSDDLMVYARLASGYRPGGPNSEPLPGTPVSFGPDQTHNYEVGLKGDVLDRRLTVDASVYYIRWDNLQLTFVDEANGNSYFANGSQAKSEGVELSIQARPITGLTLSGWVTFDNAVLTQPLPASSVVYGQPGERLPYSSRYSAYLAAEQQFPLTGRFTGTLGADVNYVGDREGVFTSSPPSPATRQVYPGYVKADVHSGLKWEAWAANLYVDNLTDRRALLTGGIGTFNPSSFAIIQPRTVGLMISRTF